MYNISMDYTEERPSYYIQNITLNYHFVSDIGLQFSPREVKDLTWEDPIVIKKSRNLKDSLRSGILRQLTEEEYEKTLELQYQKEQKLLKRSEKEKARYEKVDIGKKDSVLAETFDVMKSKRKSEELDLSGTANHPMSHVQAFEIAQNIAAERGDEITAEEFAEIVENDPTIVRKLLSQTKAMANQKQATKAFVTMPYGDGTGIVSREMTKLSSMLEPTQADISYKSGLIKDAMNLDDMDDMDDIDYASDDDMEFAEEIVVEEEEE